MALSDRDIIITPNRGAGSEPIITLRGADAASSASMVMRVINSGTVSTLSFEGTSGQLFAVSDTSAGTIFSVNDVSGIPSIEVLDSGEIKLAEYNGFVNIKGTTNATSVNSGVLRVAGGVGIAQDVYIGGTLNVTGTLNAAVIAGSITNAANVAVTNDPSNSATMYPTFVSATSGNQAIRIDSTGLVWIPSTNRLGIGTTTPVGPLHVVTGAGASDANTVILQRTAASDYSAISFRTGTTTDWSIGHNSNGGLSIFEAGAAATTRMVVKAGGNVGIGTNAPSTKLHLYEAGAANVVFTMTPANGSYDAIINMTGQDGNIATEGFQIQYRNNVGDVILKQMWTGLPGTVPAIRFSTGNTADALVILGNGNVGIGDADPTQKLVVAGSAVITGGVYGAETGAPDARIWAVSPANPTWGIFYNEGTPDYIEFQTAGTVSSRIALDSGAAHFGLSGGGRVGIGTGTPNTRLHIFQDGFANNTVNPLITLDGKFNVTTVDNNDIVAIASRIENNAGGSQTTNIIGSSFQTSFNSLLLQPSGGNVGVNNINPGRALDVTGVTNVSSHITQGPLISRPNVSWGASGSATGAVVIKFPGGTGNYGMIHAVIDIYTYDGENASTIIIGGHNWNSAWYNFGATRIGAFSKGVRLGFKDGQYCIVLGTNTSTWSYGQVVVRKIQNGSYYSGIMDLGGTYSIALDAAAESYTYISSNLITTGSAGGGGWNSGNDGSGSGLDADLLDGLDSTAFLRRDVTNTMFAGQTSQLRFENLTTFFRFAFNDLRFYDLNNGADIFGLDEHAYATTSMRAPIFYDRNDTAYYLDPASTSLLNTLQLNGNITRLGGYSPTNGAIRMTPNLHLNALASYSVIVNWDNGTTGATRTFRIGNGASTEVYYIRADGYSYQTNYAENASSFRAPIFYDSANTAYYTDPASISSMYGVAIRGDTSSVDSANQIFFWDAGDTTTSAIGFKANGGEFTNPTGNGDGYNTYLTMDTVGRGWVFRRGTGGTNFNSAFTSGWILNNGIWQANDSMRAPIFYDSNNTAFYIDAASSSIVNNLTVNGTLTYSGALSVEGSEVLTVNLQTSSGNQGWDLHGNRAIQAIYGNHNPLNNGHIYNAALFRGASWTMYGFNGTSWVNLGAVPNLTNGYGKSNWSGVTLSRAYSQFIISIGNTLGYTFMSALTLSHSTSGNSMDVFFENSTSSTYNSGTWNIMGQATGVSSWPGGTSIKFSDAVGASFPNFARLRIIPNWSHPSNEITLGQLFITAAYGGGNQLLEWDSSYNVTANGSFRSPIFYDSNNTAFYLDPNSTTISLNMAGSVRAATFNKPGILSVASGTASTGASLAIQQETSEGWTGIFVDFEPNTGWGLYHDNPNNFFSFTAETATGSIRSFAVPSRTSGNRTAHEKFRVDQTSGDTITGAIGFAQSSFRAPIFYDSNNTAYYTDQAGTSNYFNLQITGASNKYLYINPGNGYEAMVRYNGGSGSGWYVGKRISSQVVGTESFHFYSEAAGQTVGGIDTSGNIFARDSMRAPIFYDNNDTSYYVNPNTESRLNRLRVGPYAGSVSAGNVTGLELVNNGGTGDSNVAAMSFHCAGQYAVHLHLRADSYFGMGGWSASSWRWYVQASTGNMTAAGEVTAYSDPRLKENIEKIASPLERISKLSGVKFKWKEISVIGNPGSYDYGVIADEVEEQFPELVYDSAYDAPEGDKYKTVAYSKFVPILIEAIKEQQTTIDQLRAEMQELKELVKQSLGK
jgi:hypothetical protein